MSQIESDYIEAINADPDNRMWQLGYADWLEGIGDPRAEAWRVLIEAGKRPEYWGRKEESSYYCWWYEWGGRTNRSQLLEMLTGMGPYEFWQGDLGGTYPTFFAAMDAACIAWVRRHRDQEFSERD